ncbi:hypothetical protein JW960_04690 [candidate division KSB1 bacterium]|nr:hypothetical protein [candidate division KSB1 bacterium]
MKEQQRATTPVSPINEEANVELTQFEFDAATQRAYRELKNELERLKIENKINAQINKMLSERLSKLKD